MSEGKDFISTIKELFKDCDGLINIAVGGEHVCIGFEDLYLDRDNLDTYNLIVKDFLHHNPKYAVYQYYFVNSYTFDIIKERIKHQPGLN